MLREIIPFPVQQPKPAAWSRKPAEFADHPVDRLHWPDGWSGSDCSQWRTALWKVPGSFPRGVVWWNSRKSTGVQWHSWIGRSRFAGAPGAAPLLSREMFQSRWVYFAWCRILSDGMGYQGFSPDKWRLCGQMPSFRAWNFKMKRRRFPLFR